MKRIYSAAHLPDAHIALNLLAEAGIDARIFNENAQGGLGEIPFTAAFPEVWVMRDRDAERARVLLDNFRRRAPDPGSVNCAICGEDNPGDFQLCWNCGGELGTL